MKVERDFLVQTLKDAGVKGKIHESMKSLKNCNEIHVGVDRLQLTGQIF